jgi:exodeoxyribonuclease VII small subunit
VSGSKKKKLEEVAETPGDDLSLEERLQRLDRIVATLEGGEVELERGLELFEEGVRHIRAAEALLSRAELRVEELIGDVESLEVRPFGEEPEA